MDNLHVSPKPSRRKASKTQQGYEPNHPATIAMATAAQRQAAADRGTPLEDLTEEEFSKLWMMGMSSERTLGRPREWNGKEEGFGTFAFKFANWLSGMPGNAEQLLDKAAIESEPILMERLDFKKRVMAKGVNQALRGLVEGKALDIAKSVEEKGNGFEAWRRLWAEYRPQTAGRKVSLVEAVMQDRPKEGEDFLDVVLPLGRAHPPDGAREAQTT